MVMILALVIAIPLGLDLYMPVPEANPITKEKVELGRRLFSDRRLSRSGSIACASCHDPDRAFSDARPLAVGVFGRVGRRHAPALINRGYGRAFFWDGRIKTLEDQVLKPIQDPNEMDLTLAEASARVGLSADTISRALATYIRSILSADSPYDRFANGNRAALSPEQQAGLQVFRGRGNCVACHVGPTLTDEQFHNTGVAWRNGSLQDEGRERGTFKTPTLREVARTAPYMHDGSIATLEDVVEFYDGGGRANPHLDREIRPLHLTADQKRALLSFLKSLSGTIREGTGQAPRPATRTAARSATATLTSLTITPSEQTIGAGGSAYYQATGTLTDGTIVDATHMVTWAISAMPEVIVISPGHIRALAATTATVLASSGNLSASAILIVR